ncbi:hypothetical protein BUALT_Bualt02G0053700 [Buddleja alternifolia]|uniref:Zinc finger BED domain-containing protein RICESLEEPER 2-like n=1 Tax=Buddleja alternifolia TaxID=168488 RepID=A0AAV6XY64_9LAMI|nr:hypothetical protein BUALT_Bualt02G0053700 [Buddleja alternifolia]
MAQNTSDVHLDDNSPNDAGASNNSQEREDKSEKRKRDPKKRFMVWSHFSKFTKKEGTSGCKCNYCKKIFSLPLNVYKRIEAEKQKQVENGQKTLAFQKDYSKDGPDVVVWKFDQECSRRDLCELIIVKELPFSLVEDPAFQGLDDIRECIKRVRQAVKYVKASPKRKNEFLQYADQERIPRGKMLVLDVCTRWNSTYLMLRSALHYRKAYDRSQFCTENVFFREVYHILVLLRENSNDQSTLLGGMALSMLIKFEKYWIEKEPNILLSVALVLDPRYKPKYLKFCYNKIYDSLLVGGTTERIEKELHALFNEYLALYETSHCKKECYGKDNEVNHEANSDKSSLRKVTNFMEEFYKFCEEEDATGNKSELDVYLEEKLHPSKNNDNFDILQYWKDNESKFPVLSRMAKDILAIPMSSVASESAFSTSGRVLSKFHSSVLPSTVEALICAQDWIRSGPVHIGYDEEFDTSFSLLWNVVSIHQDVMTFWIKSGCCCGDVNNLLSPQSISTTAVTKCNIYAPPFSN